MNESITLGIGYGGWVEYSADNLDHQIFLRYVEADDGRLEVADLFVPFERAPRTADIRELAECIAHVDARLNARGLPERDFLLAKMGRPGPDLRTAAGHFATNFGPRSSDHWVKLMLDTQRAGSELPAPPKPRKHTRTSTQEPPRSLVVHIPDTRPYPDQFYRNVAEAYGSAAARSSRPAADLASENKVAVKTVHGWIAEARKRGHLAPGRKGRAG